MSEPIVTPEDLRVAAHSVGLSVEELAREAGVSERTLVAWARGRTTPRPVTRGLVESAIRRLRRAREPAPTETTRLEDTRRELARTRVRLAQAERRNEQMRRALARALEEAA